VSHSIALGLAPDNGRLTSTLEVHIEISRLQSLLVTMCGVLSLIYV